MIGTEKRRNLIPIFKDGNLVGKRKHAPTLLISMLPYKTECGTNRMWVSRPLRNTSWRRGQLNQALKDGQECAGRRQNVSPSWAGVQYSVVRWPQTAPHTRHALPSRGSEGRESGLNAKKITSELAQVSWWCKYLKILGPNGTIHNTLKWIIKSYKTVW